MPFKSQAQQRFMFAKHPKIAKKWAAHTPDITSLPQHVSEEPTMPEHWDHPGCDDKIGKIFVVLKPGPESAPEDIMHQTHAFGMGQFEPQSVHGVYGDEEEANLVAEAACTELRKHLEEVEKKKDTVISKIDKHIARLQKEINAHMKEATEIPEMSEKHHELAERKMAIIRGLRDKHKMVKAAKKQLPEIDEKKKRMNESILGTIALGLLLGQGGWWLKTKKEKIAAADKKKAKEREKAEEDARRVKAVEDAKKVLEDPKNKETLDKIKNDNEIKQWMKTLDNNYKDDYSDWVRMGGGNSYSDAGMPPTWGTGKENETLIQKVEDKIRSYPEGENILKAMNPNSKFKYSAQSLSQK